MSKPVHQTKDNDQTIDEVQTSSEEFNEYLIHRFVASVKKELTDKSMLASELESLVDGKNIVISNSK